ncbi:succinate CoA transferase [Salinisphaera sp.]|uniref:succinate CoA transferase n=1 Tax=Salinisphaera sp. TaxID=1914330 RepID=UPI000C6818B3|nr:succinate CoA transferase [Salinisphaera sp.]MBS63415.1 propionyl-CoA--succinate CoA transferase [Salinisphaera sp.]
MIELAARRCQLPGWRDRLHSADEVAALIQDGMTVGMSGFTRAGEAKAVPLALARRAERDPLGITLMTGASLGHDIDGILADAGVLARRMPFQVDKRLRGAINRGEVMFVDTHLSEMAEQLRHDQLGALDIAVIEAVAITADGGIVPTTSVGNSASFVVQADQIIVELNVAAPEALIGLHDIYLPEKRPGRRPIPISAPDTRIGTPHIPVDPDKIAAIVLTEQQDSPAEITPANATTERIAEHLIEFFESEVAAGRMSMSLMPLQAGIGSVANAVLHGLMAGPFENLTMYSEVLQDSTFELLDHGTLRFASASAITLSDAYGARVWNNLAHYRDRIVLRPQELSNHPGMSRRLGVIAINTAIEFDIYGNVNSTHINGTRMMNGIGGSGDFARNSHLSIFVTTSTARAGALSSVVPFVSHVDHVEHDVDILVTEHGLADLRGLAPRERARLIIDRCADPFYRPALADYFETACARGGHTPHCLEQALAWHVAAERDGSMHAMVAGQI